MGTHEPVTPAMMARELQVSAKRVREHLRSRYGTLQLGETRWHLNDEQIASVRARFRSP